MTEYIRNCKTCNHIFTRNEIVNANIKNRAIIIACPSCQQDNIIKDDVSCDFKEIFRIASKCDNEPLYLLPYKTGRGIRFKCFCEEHIVDRTIAPRGVIITTKTQQAIDRAREKRYPVQMSIFAAWIIFVIVGAPIMCLYSIVGGWFEFFAMTRFSFFWLVFGLSWLVIILSEFVKLPDRLKKPLLWVWIIIFIIVLILEVSFHIA